MAASVFKTDTTKHIRSLRSCMHLLCSQRIGGQLGCILPGGHEGSHDIGPVLRRRVPVIKPVVKPLAPRPDPPPPLGPVAPVRVGDTVELELVEDEAPNEAFWAPARVTSIDSTQGAFSAKIYAPGSVWHAWIEKGYNPKAEGVEWRRAAPRVLGFTHGTDSFLLERVQAAARRQRARVTGSVYAPMRKTVKKPKLSKLHGRLLVKLRLRVAGSEVLATISPREVPRSWTAAEDGSLKEVLRGLAQRGASNIMYTTVWQEATLQLASATGMPKRSVYAVQQRYLGLRKAQQLVYATVSVTAGRVALALKPRVGLPVLPQRRHTGAHLLRALRSELDASKRALSRAQTDMKELRANVERLRAENARLDADNVTLLAAQDGVSAAYITALVGAKKCRPGDDSQWQEEVTEEKKTDSPSKEAVAAEATEAEAETVEAAAKAEAAEAATEAAKAAAAEAAAEAAVEEEGEDGVEAEEVEEEEEEEEEDGVEEEVEEVEEEGWAVAEGIAQKEEETALEPALAPAPEPTLVPTTRSASKRKPTPPSALDCPCPKRPLPAKEVRPAPQPPIQLAITSPASYATASSLLRPNQRVRVWWDKETYFDGRVIDTRSELGRGGAVQQRFQVAYDDGERRWHTADVVRVELLAEEVCQEAVCDEWLPLELR